RTVEDAAVTGFGGEEMLSVLSTVRKKEMSVVASVLPGQKKTPPVSLPRFGNCRSVADRDEDVACCHRSLAACRTSLDLRGAHRLWGRQRWVLAATGIISCCRRSRSVITSSWPIF
ncbi:hypothetical protein ACLOJK_022562, partial [Asimina triloba]